MANELFTKISQADLDDYSDFMINQDFTNPKGNQEDVGIKSHFNNGERSKSQNILPQKTKSDIQHKNKAHILGLEDSFLKFDEKLNEIEKKELENKEKNKKVQILKTDFDVLNKINFETRSPDIFQELNKKPTTKYQHQQKQDDIDFLNF
jgi:hypothetical protein